MYKAVHHITYWYSEQRASRRLLLWILEIALCEGLYLAKVFTTTFFAVTVGDRIFMHKTANLGKKLKRRDRSLAKPTFAQMRLHFIINQLKSISNTKNPVVNHMEGGQESNVTWNSQNMFHNIIASKLVGKEVAQWSRVLSSCSYSGSNLHITQSYLRPQIHPKFTSDLW